MPIDTLSIAKRMTSAGFTPEQAEAQAIIFQELVESDLATKRDLKELEVALKRDIKESEPRLEKALADAHRMMWQLTVGTAVLMTTILGFLIRFPARL